MPKITNILQIVSNVSNVAHRGLLAVRIRFAVHRVGHTQKSTRSSDTEVSRMDVQFVASVAPIVRDADAAQSFYGDALGLVFEGQEGDYRFTHELEGTKHFGLWPLSEAANACFGTTEWPADIPVPQASIEFEVADVADAAAELESKGYRLIHDARTEPWTQITSRLLSPEGLLVAVCYTPAFHEGG
jgi:catechol 2,3-dioxygenase-like lactoylglutathione lyase family enzyme